MDNMALISFLGLDKKVDNNILLKKIHLSRSNMTFPKNIIEEIETIYLETNDIRFFNELIWLCKGDISMIPKSINKFNFHFRNGLYMHNFKFTEYKYENIRPKSIVFNEDKIALIGNPLFFLIPFFKLLKLGVRPDVIHVKYHPNKYLKILLDIFYPIFKIIFGNSYSTIEIENESDLSCFSIQKKYDIGFHKLPFIIKRNVLSSFKKGLINDHWGALPFLKGRSTIFYSKLLGIPLTITNHIIDEDIDSGHILNYYKLKSKFIGLQIKLGFSTRLIESLYLLSKLKFKKINNKEGLVFYEAHPWLIKKINI